MRTGSETVLLSGSDGAHILDPIASVIWESVTGSPSIDEAVSGLVERFAAPSSRIRGDVEEVVAELIQGGLLTSDPPTTTQTSDAVRTVGPPRLVEEPPFP